MRKIILFLVTLLLGSQMLMCSNSTIGTISNQDIYPDTYLAYNIAIKALDAIDKSDYKALAAYIHPEKGVIFVPFTTISYDDGKNMIFSSDQIGKFADDNNVYNWGYIPNSQEYLKLTVSDYFKRYIWDQNYLNVNQIAINFIIRTSNAIENVTEVFKDAIFVEFYYKGTKELEELDWSSLKIVMEKYNGEFKIVAIIHSNYVL